jgi:predicted HicB family RNase H-like nuclease
MIALPASTSSSEQNMKKKQNAAAMHVRVRPSVKAAAVRLAQEDGRSLAKWLERLIEAEAARLDGKK